MEAGVYKEEKKDLVKKSGRVSPSVHCSVRFEINVTDKPSCGVLCPPPEDKHFTLKFHRKLHFI